MPVILVFGAELLNSYKNITRGQPPLQALSSVFCSDTDRDMLHKDAIENSASFSNNSCK